MSLGQNPGEPGSQAPANTDAPPAAIATADRGSYDYMWGGLEDEFQARLEAFVNASGGKLRLISGYRSPEHQADLYEAGIAKYGEANVNKWVAPPGSSNHNRGLAGDLRYMSVNDDGGSEAMRWAHANASRFGLEFPMTHEPWHIEPAGLRAGTYQGQAVQIEAYTMPPPGVPGAMDLDAQYIHGQTLRGLLSGPLPSEEVVTNARNIMAGPGVATTPGALGELPEDAIPDPDHPEEEEVSDGTTE